MDQKKEDFAENLGNSALMVVPFAKFLPLINEIKNFFNETIELVEAAEHNKRTCEILKNRVHVAELAVRELREKRKDREDFFNKINYIRLQELSIIIARIKKFISEISLMKTLIKYLKEKSVEKVFKELCGEFDVYINLLSFSINVEIADELEQLKSDQDDLFKYLQEMVAGIDDNDCFADSSKKFFSTIVKVNAMNNTMVHFTRGKFRSQTKISDIFQVHPLEFSDYESDDNEKTREYRRVYKWYKKTNKGAEFAFKLIYNRDDQMDLQSRIIILKELHDWQNIIKFYGIIYDGREWHFVNEWAEYGNLREFYQNKNDFDLKLKLRISLDIARGLNFLRTVEISHRDIRAENILITLNETAKLANFSSRYESASRSTLDKYRYYAPEVLDSFFFYDQRSEVYSFGILLWEIAEERIPHQGNNDIGDIIDKVRNKMYREPFSENNQMPEEFKQLEIEAVHHDPDFRPKITKMFEVLNNCFKKYSQVTSSSSGPNPSENSRNNSMQKFRPKRADNIDAYALPDLESFSYMTLTDAATQHRLYNRHGKLAGDLKTAYKCFEAYANFGNTGGTANRNQIKAKYYKAYYISKEFVESPPNKDKIVAELFKEVADNEANEFPEAKVRYGDCLYHGKGVDQNFSEALKYFEKAAEDGFKIAMYNVGDMYYNGVGCTKDIEKAKYYMKLAAYNNYESAITFCKEHDI